MKYYRLLFFIALTLLLQACATMFSGSKQTITFNSNPQGAEIYINGVNSNKQTPTTLELPRKVKSSNNNAKNQYNYKFTLDDYEDAIIQDMAETNGKVWLNLIPPVLYLSPIVIPIDYATGAARKYNSDVYVNLSRKAGKTIVEKQIVYVPIGDGKASYKFEKKSDVDNNIPITPNQYSNRYALIIGNEDYSSHQIELNNEINVDFARNDASAFKEYAESVLGIPNENIIFMLDATTGKMNQGIAKANRILKVTGGDAELFVYYAGHGLPDEQTQEAYIMPVDVSGKNANEGIALKDMYHKLTEFPAKRVTVFIDACFSGGARNQGLVAARGVKINPKESPMSGNLVVFSASSGVQSSLPYMQKEHGFFTYFLLKKLQESGGQINYNELSEYLISNVSLKSILINDKEQNPKVNVSSASQNIWKEWKLND